MATKFEFAGVETSLTSTGSIRKPALLKIIRSGRVEIRCDDHSDMDGMSYGNAKRFPDFSAAEGAISAISRAVGGYYAGASLREDGSIWVFMTCSQSWSIRELPLTAHEMMARARRRAA